jgi:hypothetical protein
MATRYRPHPQSDENARRMQRLAAMAGNVKGRCRSCAFRHGTAANRCERVANALELAALSAVSFHCHHNPERVCRGFDAVFIAPFRKHEENKTL